MARVIARGVLFFGFVSIPGDIHSAIEDHNIHMHLVHKKCGPRLRNQMICPVCKVTVERDDLVRGSELSKGAAQEGGVSDRGAETEPGGSKYCEETRL